MKMKKIGLSGVGPKLYSVDQQLTLSMHTDLDALIVRSHVVFGDLVLFCCFIMVIVVADPGFPRRGRGNCKGVHRPISWPNFFRKLYG